MSNDQTTADVSDRLTGKAVVRQRVSVDFSLDLLREIDAECRLISVTRQSWIKMACDERLRQIRRGRKTKTDTGGAL